MTNRFLQCSRIGETTLIVPFTTVGTMMFGGRASANESIRIVHAALDHGLNFFDTASMYQMGQSERLLGEALHGQRERCVVATKVGYGQGPDGKEEGTSRKAILRAIDKSLSDLGMDYVDIYYLHRPDYQAPLDETLQTMNEVIESGKARYFGLSNFAAWQSLEVLNRCRANGWARPVIAQMIYNPLVRQIEYEYLSFAKTHGVHVTVYNPLAGGLLTGKYASLGDEKKGARFLPGNRYRDRYWSPRYLDGMMGLKRIAEEEGMSLTHLTLNWIAQSGKVNNILLGPSNEAQLIDCLAAGERTISAEGMEKIAAYLREFEGTNACYAR
jgi:aryl-alcohol dehydrogenase-like predicted oxidoreductase